MAKAALKRRRGTRGGSRRGWAPAILGGLALLIVGLAGGVILGFLAFGGLSSTTTDGSRPSLRKSIGAINPHELIAASHAEKTQAKHIDTKEKHGAHAEEGSSAEQRKQDFLDHEVELGTSGAFPHYPTALLVAENHDFSKFKAPGGSRFEEYIHGDSPYAFFPNESDELARSRRYHVKKGMQHAWAGYEKYAFGMDELKPVSKKGNMRWGGIGTTLVDNLDTLWLMNMKDEFYRARDWCRTSLNHDISKSVSVFETTIRSLGGLLSAYDWSQDEVFLDQAKDLGKRLFKSFNTKSGLPMSQVNLADGNGSNLQWSKKSALLSEFGTLQLEFRALGRLSGIKDYKTKSEKVFEIMDNLNVPDGLYPYQVNNNKVIPSFGNDKITFGAMSDSFYEYMLKVWIQGGQQEPLFRKMYDKSIQGMHDHLLSVSSPSGLVYIADRNNGVLDKKMDHLVCFMGGLLALGAYTDPQGLQSERAQRDLKTGKALTYTCYQMYARMPTGISPEYIQFHDGRDFDVGAGAPHYLLRPEAVESFFVLYHLTGDPVYREWGWEVFQSIERYCKTDAGYGQLRDVRQTHEPAEDSMESFFLAETMKYLYLLFDPDTPIDLLHKHVFNTEAHPTRIFPQMDQDGVMDLLK